MVSLLFFFWMTPWFKALVPLNTGYHFSFFSRSTECPISFHEYWCEKLEFFEVVKLQESSFPPLLQSMSLNMDMKMILSLNRSGLMFLLSRSLWILWRICNAVNPGKIFHSNSIGSPSGRNSSPKQVTIRDSATWPFHFRFASSEASILPKHNTESE